MKNNLMPEAIADALEHLREWEANLAELHGPGNTPHTSTAIAALEAIGRVRELHKLDEHGVCAECYVDYDDEEDKRCPTIAAIDGP
jgi:hypothetical protein